MDTYDGCGAALAAVQSTAALFENSGGISGAVEAVNSLASHVKPLTKDYDYNEVNHRPAVQQWTVCTP